MLCVAQGRRRCRMLHRGIALGSAAAAPAGAMADAIEMALIDGKPACRQKAMETIATGCSGQALRALAISPLIPKRRQRCFLGTDHRGPTAKWRRGHRVLWNTRVGQLVSATPRGAWARSSAMACCRSALLGWCQSSTAPPIAKRRRIPPDSIAGDPGAPNVAVQANIDAAWYLSGDRYATAQSKS